MIIAGVIEMGVLAGCQGILSALLLASAGSSNRERRREAGREECGDSSVNVSSYMWSAVKDRSMFLNIRVKSLARLKTKKAWLLIV